ncbi:MULTISPECIES: transglutaminase TgpA family protein [unclassified Microbacterium]|uniref:transglutaminase TgpA family protein n=1 Tax=unclassified Microbacterium TaxID=2609290 RepID=UPI0030162905
MSGSDAARRRPRGEVRLTIALWLAIAVTMVPLLRVVHSGGWVPGSALIGALVLACGFALRRTGRVPAVAITLVELAVWAGAVTAVFFPAQALLGVIPSGGVVAEAVDTVRTAGTEIFVGVAPIESSPAIAAVIVGSVGLLAVGLDHVVLTARLPLLAAVALVIVWLVPAIAVPAGVDVLAFVLLSAAILWLLRAETRTREAPAPASRAGGVTAVAIAIGAVAITAALVAGPALPPPTAAPGGTGLGASIDPSLDLGDDLRRPNDVPVLTARTDAPQPPYLRVATLSLFDGEVWQPDRTRSVPLSDGALEEVAAGEGIRITEYRTNVAVSQLASTYLPVPFPAVGVTGLQGDDWRAVPYNRTVLTGNGSVQGQNYEVVSHVPRPTREQIRAAPARATDASVDLYAVPAGTPSIVGEVARRVTAGASNDYDRLIALQSWFRGPEFTYSLTAPVQDGFDDAGVDAVAAFLDRKEGYCIHFAGSFALMARTLGMPSRIVVGFLPGTPTNDAVDGQRVVEVTTGQLHAWPEVYFEGIGWVPFEPTKGLGTATQFASAAEPVEGGGEDVVAPTAAPTPTASPTAAPVDRPDQPSEAGAPIARAIDPWPFLTTLLTVLIVAGAPAGIAWVRRRMLHLRGDVAAAWRIVQDASIDLAIPVRPSESPRAFGARLVAVHGAPRAEVARLVDAMERASYAPDGGRLPDDAGAAAISAAEAVRRALWAGVGGSERWRRAVLPRSLVIRPGSAFADRDAPA